MQFGANAFPVHVGTGSAAWVISADSGFIRSGSGKYGFRGMGMSSCGIPFREEVFFYPVRPLFPKVTECAFPEWAGVKPKRPLDIPAA